MCWHRQAQTQTQGFTKNNKKKRIKRIKKKPFYSIVYASFVVIYLAQTFENKVRTALTTAALPHTFIISLMCLFTTKYTQFQINLS